MVRLAESKEPRVVVGPGWLTLDETAYEARYRPASYGTRAYLHQTVARALRPSIVREPTDDEIRQKPLLVDLNLPLPPRLRIYVFGATQHASERQLGTFRVQLTDGVRSTQGNSTRLHFDRGDNVRPILCGYHRELRVFILWDADLHDTGDGFAFSKGVQAPPDLVWDAAARGMASATRRLKRPATTETIVAARPAYLVAALTERISLSNESVAERVI
ncbi:hypothetical protein [Cellulomonas soli]